MNRNNIESLRHRIADKTKSIGGKIAAGTTALVLAPAVFAQTASLGEAAQAEVAGVKGDVSAILIVLVSVVFLLVAWSYFKRAK